MRVLPRLTVPVGTPLTCAIWYTAPVTLIVWDPREFVTPLLYVPSETSATVAVPFFEPADPVSMPTTRLVLFVFDPGVSGRLVNETLAVRPGEGGLMEGLQPSAL